MPLKEVHSVVGLYLWTWAIFTGLMLIASLRTTGAIVVVLLLLLITFIFLAIGNSALAGTLSTQNSTIKIGGYLGLVTAIAAWYTAIAAVLASTFGRESARLPAGPVGPAVHVQAARAPATYAGARRGSKKATVGSK